MISRTYVAHMLPGALFFISGFVALIYQVVWFRSLSLFLGSDAYSASITLSVFMLGLAIGSILTTRIRNLKYPIAIYGACEILAATFTYLLPLELSIIDPLYMAAQNLLGTGFLNDALRFVTAFASLAIPSVALGATFPLLTAACTRRIHDFARISSTLYAANTFGAVAGTLSAAFLLMPQLGLIASATFAAGIGCLIGLAAVLMDAVFRFSDRDSSNVDSERVYEVNREQYFVLAATFLSGCAAFALEVVWVRSLSQILSSSVLSFAIMVACFLIGSAAGSFIVSRVLHRISHPTRALAYVFALSAAAVSCSALASLYSYATLEYARSLIPQTYYLAEFIASLSVPLLPAMFFGAAFSLSLAVYGSYRFSALHSSAIVFTANTIGCALGALIGGYILLPFFGPHFAIIAVSFLSIISCALILRDWSAARHPALYAACTVCVIGLIIITQDSNIPVRVIAAGSVVSTTTYDVLFSKSGPLNTTRVIRIEDGRVHLSVNNWPIASARPDATTVAHFELASLLPLYLHENPEHIMIVGLGTGITARTALEHGTKSVRIVEISREVIAAQSAMSAMNKGSLGDPRVALQIGDARNFIRWTPERYDIIGTDPIHPVRIGQGYLYAKEYYEHSSKRLEDGGIMIQWVPTSSISQSSFDVALRTFAEIFPHATLWYGRGNIYLVGSLSPIIISCDTLEKNIAASPYKGISLFGEPINSTRIGSLFLMGDTTLREYLSRHKDVRINTDDNMYLEYTIPLERTHEEDLITRTVAKFARNDVMNEFSCSSSEMLALVKARESLLNEMDPER